MKSGAGRTPQRHVCVAIVGRRIRKPSLDLHARFRASIEHRAHPVILELLAAHKLIHRKTRSRSGRAAAT
jgi:hypothetical protein